MKIYYELDLNNFEAWSGAVDTLDRIREENKCDALEFILEDMYPDGMSDTELNDLLWFEPEQVFDWLGISEEDEEEEEEMMEYTEGETEKEYGDFDSFCNQYPMCSGCPYCPIQSSEKDCEEIFEERLNQPTT